MQVHGWKANMSPRNDKAYNVSEVDPDSFGAQLRRYRLDAGLSQQELGEITGVGQARVSTYERGRNLPNRETIVVLAEALNIAPSLLFEATKFGGVLALSPERREKLKQLHEADWRMFDHVLDVIGDVTPEERARFEDGFEKFLREWK